MKSSGGVRHGSASRQSDQQSTHSTTASTARSASERERMRSCAVDRSRAAGQPCEARMAITAINPTDGAPLETFAETTSPEVDALLGRAEAAFADWRQRSFA